MKKNCSLVIGSTGLIGRELVRLLDKDSTYCISRKASEINNTKKHFNFDISERNKLEDLLKQLASKYQSIHTYFLAGESSVEKSIINPKESLMNSITPFIEFLNIMTKFKSKIVIASSGSVYDSRKSLNAFVETDSVYAPSPYAASKLSLESISQSYCESFNLDIKIARIFSVYGEDMERFFIYDLVKKFINEEIEINLDGSGQQVRDYLHVHDVAVGLQLVLNNGERGEVYNLCSGEPTSLDSLSKNIRKIMNKKEVEIIWNKTEIKGQRDIWYGNNSKIKSLGFKYTPLSKNIESLVNSISLKFDTNKQ